MARKVRVANPFKHPLTGEQFAPGQVVDLDDDLARSVITAGYGADTEEALPAGPPADPVPQYSLDTETAAAIDAAEARAKATSQALEARVVPLEDALPMLETQAHAAAAYVAVGSTNVDVGRVAAGDGVETAQIQALIDASPAGAVFHFPRKGAGHYTLDAGLKPSAPGQRFRFERGVEVRQTVWEQPGIDILDTDDVTVDGGVFRYVGTRGGTGATVRGNSGYNMGAAIWSNGHRTRVLGARVIGHASGVMLSCWDSTTSVLVSKRTKDCRVTGLEASGVNFGVIWTGQDGLAIHDLLVYDLVDDSSGANPIHAIYASGSPGVRSANFRITDALCRNAPFGAAYQIKYTDGVTGGKLAAERCGRLLNALDITDAELDGLTLRDTIADASGPIIAFQTPNSQRVRLRDVLVDDTNGAAAPAAANVLNVVADDLTIDGVKVYTNRAAATGNYDVIVGGSDIEVLDLSLVNRGAAAPALSIGKSSAAATRVYVGAGFRTRAAARVVDINRDSTDVTLELDTAQHRSVGAWPASGLYGIIGTGAEPAVEVAPTGGAAAIPGRPGSWHTFPEATTSAAATITAGNARARDLPLARRVRLDRIACEVTTAAPAAVVRFIAMYDDGTGFPGRIVDLGTVDATTVGIKELAIDLRVNAGLLWVAAVPQGADLGMRVTVAASPRIGLGSVAAPPGSGAGLSQTGIADVPPAQWTGTGRSGSAPLVWVRTAQPTA